MNIEEAKKIIQNKIQADEAAREVRSQIKTCIHQKQDAREGFTETFKPLIETSEKVKESIDTQQNKLIKQLQENQLALTAGFDKNRLAITSGFDKMDEVKKWDLQQLPGYEAIEEPEKEPEEDESEEDESEKEPEKEPEKRVATFGDEDLDEGLISTEDEEILNKLNLPLPSKLKNRKKEDIKSFQIAADAHFNEYHDLLASTRAILYTEKGVNKAKKLNDDPTKETIRRIKYYNTLGQYIYNLNSLVKYAKKKQDKVSSISITHNNLFQD